MLFREYISEGSTKITNLDITVVTEKVRFQVFTVANINTVLRSLWMGGCELHESLRETYILKDLMILPEKLNKLKTCHLY